jgi:hypothetical protein
MGIQQGVDQWLDGWIGWMDWMDDWMDGLDGSMVACMDW